jgi:hypothetical protein
LYFQLTGTVGYEWSRSTRRMLLLTVPIFVAFGMLPSQCEDVLRVLVPVPDSLLGLHNENVIILRRGSLFRIASIRKKGQGTLYSSNSNGASACGQSSPLSRRVLSSGNRRCESRAKEILFDIQLFVHRVLQPGSRGDSKGHFKTNCNSNGWTITSYFSVFGSTIACLQVTVL